MPKKSMETLTEAMFYVLMALSRGEMCGIEAAEYAQRQTVGRVIIGPATLYTILGKFEHEHWIEEICVEGRKRTYRITARGLDAYRAEIARLEACLHDAANPVPVKGGIEDENGYPSDPLPAV